MLSRRLGLLLVAAGLFGQGLSACAGSAQKSAQAAASEASNCLYSMASSKPSGRADRPVPITCQPFLMKALAMQVPKPWLVPVTTAVFITT